MVSFYDKNKKKKDQCYNYDRPFTFMHFTFYLCSHYSLHAGIFYMGKNGRREGKSARTSKAARKNTKTVRARTKKWQRSEKARAGRKKRFFRTEMQFDLFYIYNN